MEENLLNSMEQSLQLVKKFSAFYGMWGFIITFARTYHLSLS
jgi:hypothetical protein